MKNIYLSIIASLLFGSVVVRNHIKDVEQLSMNSNVKRKLQHAEDVPGLEMAHYRNG
jgi:hypothetical protein